MMVFHTQLAPIRHATPCPPPPTSTRQFSVVRFSNDVEAHLTFHSHVDMRVHTGTPDQVCSRYVWDICQRSKNFSCGE